MPDLKKLVFALILLLPFRSNLLNAQPVVSLTTSGGPCSGDTLNLSSSLPNARIIWKQNGVPVDTETKKLLNYAATAAAKNSSIDTTWSVNGVAVDTNGNVFVSFEASQPATIPPPPAWGPIYSIWKYPAGSSNGTMLVTEEYIGNIYVDENDTVYFAALTPYNGGIMKLAPGASSGTYVAGGNGFGPGPAANQVDFPGGVFVDGNRNIYVSDYDNALVEKWEPGATSGVIIAGGNGIGYTDSQLNYPKGIFVDDSGNLYVADYAANRVQKWPPFATTGITVAGDSLGTPGSVAYLLDGPTAVYVDDSGNIFVTDQNNNRIQKFAPGSVNGVTILGGNGQGSANNQFDAPVNCVQDKYGNVYVADGGNGRVQRFADMVLPYYITNTGGSYTALVTAANGGGSATTAADTVLDYQVPGATISALNNNSICLSYDTIQVTAIPSYGGTAPTYDWYKNLYYLFTTTSNSITLPGIANADMILCTINSNYVCLYPPGFAESNEITITVDSFSTTQTASITANPGNVIQYGQNVSFTVATTNGGAAYQWYKNSNIIPGATDSVYSSNTLLNGDEITCVSQSNFPCVWNHYVVSNVIHMKVALGVGQLSNVIHDLSLFPNPNNGVFNISGSIDPSLAGADVLIELLDMPGKLLQQERATAQNGTFVKQIVLGPSLANGVYLLRISAAGTNQTLRFVIDR